jgi:hypothetical protein
MKLYWASMIIQDTPNSEAWLCSMYDGCFSLEEAKKVIETKRKNNNVLSAWIDVTCENVKGKELVFHECYMK